MEPVLLLRERPTDADFAAIDRPLDAFNDDVTAALGLGRQHPESRLAVVVEQQGTVTGGLWGRTYYGWLFIQLLFVPAALRGQGIGTRLMAMAEREAVRRDCHGAWLDTFSFQGRQGPDRRPSLGFYRSLGYRVFGEIEDCPPGQSRYLLKKRLPPATTNAPP